MTLRCCGCETVPMIGPRSCGLAAPQWIGKRTLPAGSGWEVRRMAVGTVRCHGGQSKKSNRPPGRPVRMLVTKRRWVRRRTAKPNIVGRAIARHRRFWPDFQKVLTGVAVVYPLPDGRAHAFRPARRHSHADRLLPAKFRGSEHTRYILAFAGACALGSVYGFLQGAWPFGLIEAIWAGVALWRWRHGENGWVERASFEIGDIVPPVALQHETQPVIGRRYSNLKNSSREIFDCLSMSRTSRSGRSPGCTETVVRRVGSLPCTK